MKRIVLFTSLVFGSICCKKSDNVEEYQPLLIPCSLSKDLDTARLYIQGTWHWLEEKRVDRVQQKFVYLTPQNQGYTLAMRFSKDTVRFFKNDQPDSVYTYTVTRQTEITGTSFPEDNDPVLVFYNLHNGLRSSYVPLKICTDYLLLQHQYVSSVVGQRIWKKQ